jgi:hypothetical protein
MLVWVGRLGDGGELAADLAGGQRDQVARAGVAMAIMRRRHPGKWQAGRAGQA